MKHIKKKYVFFGVTIFVLLLGTLFLLPKLSPKQKKTIIYEVLQSDDYTSLSSDVKKFIIDTYNKTGEVVLLENNKEENKPYLNPEFIEYLSMPKSERIGIDLVPDVYIVEYSNDLPYVINDASPSSYDLRNVGGKNYISNLKNQDILGICWAFATTEIAESYMMIKNGNHSDLSFSVRQLDYAVSKNGLSNQNSEFGSGTLGSGGNFILATPALVNGATFINNSYWPFNTSLSSKKYHEVFNNTKSLYEVNSTLSVPRLNIANLDLNNQDDVAKKDNYLNLIKSHIISDGGAYVGTQAPGYSCASDYNGNQIIRVDNSCGFDEGHAMQVIGWDDNFQYKYCKTGVSHSSSLTGCSSSNIVSGKGAWLLRNSWGNSFSYIYLAYDSLNDSFSFITDMTSMSNKTWDYSYHKQVFTDNYLYFSSSETEDYNKNTSGDELVKKVKFYSYSVNGRYSVKVCPDVANSGSCISKTVNNDYPGYLTVDFSSSNITLSKSKFSVTVTSLNETDIVENSIAVFTKNKTNNISIYTPTETFNKMSNKVISETRNIPDGSLVTYKLINSSSADVSNLMTVENNVVALGKVYANISFSKQLPDGTYKLKTSYNGVESESSINYQNTTEKISVSYNANGGSGTMAADKVFLGDPYNIKNNIFTRTGYIFNGWNTKANGSGTSYSAGATISSVSSGITLYAKWTPIKYTIRYNYGFNNLVVDKVIQYDEVYIIPNNKYYYEYAFNGWNVNSTFTGKYYHIGDSIKNLTTENNKVINLYASWSTNKIFTVKTYDYLDSIIDDLPAGISVNTLKQNIILASGYTYNVYKNGSIMGTNDIIGTGSVVKIFKGDNIVFEITNIVRGDVNGDGKITSADYILIRKHIMETQRINGDYQTRGADANKDSKITSADYIKIRKYIMNGGTF